MSDGAPGVSVVVLSKDEPHLAATLAGLRDQAPGDVSYEVLVIDASRGRLQAIADAHPEVRWTDFVAPAGVRVSIPHQRNAGVAASRAPVITFLDAGSVPGPGWLAALTAPVRAGREPLASGPTVPAEGRAGLYDVPRTAYLTEAGTGNLAFRRDVFDRLGGFDERFEYGSDVDFSWRAVEAGLRIRNVPQATVAAADWGAVHRAALRSEAARAFRYGRARARLYRKHRHRRRRMLRDDPVSVVYPAFLLGLPLARRFPAYLLLLAVPLYRNRHRHPLTAVGGHLLYGLGVLREGLSAAGDRYRRGRR